MNVIEKTTYLLQHLQDSSCTIVESFNNRDRAELVTYLCRLGPVFNLFIMCKHHTCQAMVRHEIACNSGMYVVKIRQFFKLREEKQSLMRTAMSQLIYELAHIIAF